MQNNLCHLYYNSFSTLSHSLFTCSIRSFCFLFFGGFKVISFFSSFSVFVFHLFRMRICMKLRLELFINAAIRGIIFVHNLPTAWIIEFQKQHMRFKCKRNYFTCKRYVIFGGPGTKLTTILIKTITLSSNSVYNACENILYIHIISW